jgi:uncharacterized protein YjiS (DUF1127 family)
MQNTLLTQIAGFFGDIGRARTAMLNYDRLNAMGDRRLAELGLTRGELPAEALRRAFR